MESSDGITGLTRYHVLNYPVNPVKKCKFPYYQVVEINIAAGIITA